MDDAYTLTGPLALSRSTVDRAARLRGDSTWQDRAWRDSNTRVLLVGDGRVAVTDGALAFIDPGSAPEGERILLGTDSHETFVAVHVPGALDDGETANGNGAGIGLREVGAILGDRDAGLAVHAIALANWHATHRYCPRCGQPTVVGEAGHVRRCTADGSEHYPRVDPAVIMLVTDEQDRCLLGRQAKWPARRYSTLAGFVEPGETPERAVAREVAEEVGITVESCRYAGAQPWPFPSSLMLGFYATARDQQPRPDQTEIVEAGWFTRAELAGATAVGEVRLPPPVSIARRLIEGWYGGPLDTPPGRV